MRILSQYGMIFNDIPYEKFCLGITRDRATNNFCVVAREMLASESGFKLGDVMAEYSTEVKARKAMEMLRDRYTGKDETVFEIAHIKRSSTDNFYFQFPADDEVEV